LIKKIVLCATFCLLAFFLARCDSTEPPIEAHGLVLELKDVTCTEAWIELSTINLRLPTSVTLKQNNQSRETISVVNPDTLLYIDSLLPNTNYTFQSFTQQINQTEIKSNEISVTTMDTTSHNFTYEAYVFGDEYQSSILFDVAIINENSIWVVGEIYLLDSIGQPIRYNAVHWDGSEWNLYRIMFYTFCGQQHQNTYPASSIIAFSEEEIWITMKGDQIAKIENGSQTQTICLPWTFSINKIWGRSSDDLYVIGSNGNIARYFNGSWRRIFSGTTLGLSDIYGNENGDIYACGGNLSSGQGIVLKINSNNTVTKIIDSYFYGSGFDSTKMFTENLYGPLVGTWVADDGTVYTVGNLIYIYRNSKWNYAKGIEYNYLGAGEFTGRGFSWEISGEGNNDFIFVGERNTVRYFNGIRAVQIGEPFSYTSEYQWYSVDYKQNTAVAAGKRGGYAAVIIFKR
jgi:hypothetical protein